MLPVLHHAVSARTGSLHGLGLLLAGGGLELLSSSGLCLCAQVLNLGLAEDDVGVRGGALEHIGGLDDEQNLQQKEICQGNLSGRALRRRLATKDLPTVHRQEIKNSRSCSS